jgi:hypothetical protein
MQRNVRLLDDAESVDAGSPLSRHGDQVVVIARRTGDVDGAKRCGRLHPEDLVAGDGEVLQDLRGARGIEPERSR